METFVNDTIQITINTNIDVSGYAELQIRYRRPDGTTGCWPAILCALDNECMYYETVIGDLDQAGEWIIQGRAVDAGVQLTGTWCKFTVYDQLVDFCTSLAPTTLAPTTAGP